MFSTKINQTFLFKTQIFDFEKGKCYNKIKEVRENVSQKRRFISD